MTVHATWQKLLLLLAVVIPALYFTRIGADSIGGLFGIFWGDEGIYLLSAKNQVLFGTPHFIEHDLWIPEFMTPLLHYFALLVMTQSEPLIPVRVGMGICVMLSALLIARLAASYHRDRWQGIACFVTIIISPVLFFYGRAGLTESIQLLLFSLALTCLYRMLYSNRPEEAARFAFGAGLLAGIIFIAKISAVFGCIGLSCGILAVMHLRRSAAKKYTMLMAYIAGGLFSTGVFFLGYIGSAFPDWWRANILMQAVPHAPLDPISMLNMFVVKMPSIAHYLSLMPVFALYYLSLITASDRKRGFIFVLFWIAIPAILLESVCGGAIRRNFFGLNMLTIITGFTIGEYIMQGIPRRPRPVTLSWVIAVIIIVLHALGMLYFTIWGILRHDTPYSIFGSIFLVLLLLAFFLRDRRFFRPRRLVLYIFILSALAVMIGQAFFTPRTREELTRQLSDVLPVNAMVTGNVPPWALTELHRRLIFTNCDYGMYQSFFANDVNDVQGKADYYLGGLLTAIDKCAPVGMRRYELLSVYAIFSPKNLGEWRISEENWQYKTGYFLYKKPDGK